MKNNVLVESIDLGEAIVKGSTPFRVPVEKFYITPLPSASKIYLLDSIENTQIETEISDIAAGKYTAVRGVKGSAWRLDVPSSVKFKVKW